MDLDNISLKALKAAEDYVRHANSVRYILGDPNWSPLDALMKSYEKYHISGSIACPCAVCIDRRFR